MPLTHFRNNPRMCVKYTNVLLSGMWGRTVKNQKTLTVNSRSMRHKTNNKDSEYPPLYTLPLNYFSKARLHHWIRQPIGWCWVNKQIMKKVPVNLSKSVKFLLDLWFSSLVAGSFTSLLRRWINGESLKRIWGGGERECKRRRGGQNFLSGMCIKSLHIIVSQSVSQRVSPTTTKSERVTVTWTSERERAPGSLSAAVNHWVFSLLRINIFVDTLSICKASDRRTVIKGLGSSFWKSWHQSGKRSFNTIHLNSVYFHNPRKNN